MKGLAYRKVSWLPSVKKISYSQMSPTGSSKVMTESVALLDRSREKRCCCGLFRMRGPDSAWSWLVALANFLISFIIVGLGRMSGILYVDFMNMFNINRQTASVPFSVQQAARNLFGPVAGILGQKYGLRAVTILGGFIGSLSAVIAYFKMDITSITILWGLFFGISTALTTTLNQVSIDQYFEKHRGTAGGFAFSGGCVGAFLFPVVLEALIPNYGMKGTFLVLGAIILNVVPAAMMLGEPPWQQGDVTSETYGRNITRYGSLEVGELKHSSSVVQKKKESNPLGGALRFVPSAAGIDFEYLQANSDIVLQFLMIEFPREGELANSNQDVLQKMDKTHLLSELECVYSSVVSREQNRSVPLRSLLQESEKSATESYGGARPKIKTGGSSFVVESKDVDESRLYIANKLRELYEIRATRIIARFPYPDQARACKVLIELRKLLEKLNEEPELQILCQAPQDSATEDTDDDPQIQMDIENSNSFCAHFKTAFRLHSNPLFLLICLCRGVFMLTFIPVVTIIVDFAMDKGLAKSDGNYAIAAVSLGDFLGRSCLGWVTDRKCLSLPRYMFVVMVLLGVSTATLPLVHTRETLLGCVMFFAILQGSLFVRHPMLVSQYLKSHEKSIGMGFINFLSGFLAFAFPAFIGYFRDVLGSYDKMFYVNGIICAAAGLLWLLEPLFIRVSSAKSVKG